MFYTYGYDGSGVAMRVDVEIIADLGETSWVRFPGFVPPFDRYTERQITERSREVPTRRLTTDRVAHLASFNFLD